jgi:hypothetical protein
MDKSLKEKNQGHQGLQDPLLNIGYPTMKILCHRTLAMRGGDGDAHPSTFPCANFLSDAGILEDFLLLVDRVVLTTYMTDESNQYDMLTKIFVESFKFTNSHFKPSIAFKIYDKSITMYLEKFCGILGNPMFGTAKKIQN